MSDIEGLVAPHGHEIMNRTMSLIGSADGALAAGNSLASGGAPLLLESVNKSTAALNALSAIASHPSLRISLEEAV